jgi:hypothetical protein
MYIHSADGFAIGQELEIMDVGAVSQLQNDDQAPSTPQVAAVFKIQSSTPSNIGKWGLFLYPIPSSTFYVSAIAELAPYKLDSAVTTDRFDVTEAESRTIVARRAYRIAARQGREESLLNSIMSMLPMDQQALLGRKAEAEAGKV